MNIRRFIPRLLFLNKYSPVIVTTKGFSPITMVPGDTTNIDYEMCVYFTKENDTPVVIVEVNGEEVATLKSGEDYRIHRTILVDYRLGTRNITIKPKDN